MLLTCSGLVGYLFSRDSGVRSDALADLSMPHTLFVLSLPLANHLQPPYMRRRVIYEVREGPSRIYSWSAFITAYLLVEIPWNLFGSLLLFLSFYWTVGFSANRLGYSYLMLGVVFPLYYSSFALVVASIAPSPDVGNLLFSTLFSFMLAW